MMKRRYQKFVPYQNFRKTETRQPNESFASGEFTICLSMILIALWLMIRSGWGLL